MLRLYIMEFLKAKWHRGTINGWILKRIKIKFTSEK